MGAAFAALVAMLTQLTRFVLASRTVGSAEAEMVTRKGLVRPAGCKVIALWAETAAAQKIAVIKMKLRIKTGNSSQIRSPRLAECQGIGRSPNPFPTFSGDTSRSNANKKSAGKPDALQTLRAIRELQKSSGTLQTFRARPAQPND